MITTPITGRSDLPDHRRDDRPVVAAASGRLSEGILPSAFGDEHNQTGEGV
jgi:hypothetical protein